MIKHTRRRHLALIGAALATPALPRFASAQAWPSKQIRAVIPFTAGSTVDIVSRIVFEPLSQALGQSIIVENRGGEGGPRRLHGPRAFLRPRGDARDLSKRALQHRKRFRDGRGARLVAEYH